MLRWHLTLPYSFSLPDIVSSNKIIPLFFITFSLPLYFIYFFRPP